MRKSILDFSFPLFFLKKRKYASDPVLGEFQWIAGFDSGINVSSYIWRHTFSLQVHGETEITGSQSPVALTQCVLPAVKLASCQVWCNNSAPQWCSTTTAWAQWAHFKSCSCYFWTVFTKKQCFIEASQKSWKSETVGGKSKGQQQQQQQWWWQWLKSQRSAHLFFLECSSFPLFTPKILVMRVLNRRVEEFLTCVVHGHTHTKEKKEELHETSSVLEMTAVKQSWCHGDVEKHTQNSSRKYNRWHQLTWKTSMRDCVELSPCCTARAGLTFNLKIECSSFHLLDSSVNDSHKQHYSRCCTCEHIAGDGQTVTGWVQFVWAEQSRGGTHGWDWVLTAQTGEVKPSTAACRPSAMNGMMFSPRRVSLYRALRMLSAWTWWHTTHTYNLRYEMPSSSQPKFKILLAAVSKECITNRK